MFDFFDTGIMEGLHHRLRQISALTDSTNSITFQGQCMMRRMSFGGVKECFVQWSPREIISDEWLPESKSPYVKTVDIRRMGPAEKTRVESLLMTSYKLPYFPNLFERIIAHKSEQTNSTIIKKQSAAEPNANMDVEANDNATEAEAEVGDDVVEEGDDDESNNQENNEDDDEEEEDNDGTDETDADASTTITSNTNNTTATTTNTTTSSLSLEQLVTSIGKINLLQHKKHTRKPQRTTRFNYNNSNNKSLL